MKIWIPQAHFTPSDITGLWCLSCLCYFFVLTVYPCWTTVKPKEKKCLVVLQMSKETGSVCRIFKMTFLVCVLNIFGGFEA